MFSSQLHNTMKYVPVTVIIHLMNRMGDPEGTCKDHLTQYSQSHMTEWSPREEKSLAKIAPTSLEHVVLLLSIAPRVITLNL